MKHTTITAQVAFHTGHKAEAPEKIAVERDDSNLLITDGANAPVEAEEVLTQYMQELQRWLVVAITLSAPLVIVGPAMCMRGHLDCSGCGQLS